MNERVILFVYLQLLLTVFLVVLLWSLYVRLRKQEFFRWWAWAWTLFAIFLAAGTVALQLGPKWTLIKGSVVLLTVLAGFLQVPLLILGARALRSQDSVTRRWRTIGPGLALALGTLSFALSLRWREQAAISFSLRSAPRTIALALALFFCALVFLRQWWRNRSIAAAITATFCILYAIDQSLYSIVYVHRLIALPGSLQQVFELSLLLSPQLLVLDLAASCGICLGMVLLLVEDHQRAEQSLHESLSRGREISERNLALEAEIAGRRQAEAALHRSEEQYRRVVDHLHDALMIDDAAGHVVFANDRFLQLFGIDRKELGTVNLEDYVALEWRVELRDRHDRRVRGESVPERFEYEGLRRNGQRVWLEVNVVAIRDSTGNVTHTQSVIRDITERKRAEEALLGVSGRLIEAQEKERTRIARELHDDINQRIALLAGELTQLQQDLSDSAVVLSLQGSCERLSDLGKDVQSLSHRLHSSKLDYLGLAAAARSFCHELSEQQHVEIDFNQADITGIVSKEISLCLFRVLQEALQNAVKHSGVKHFKVDMRKADDEIRLMVSDSGIGFDAEVATVNQGLGLISMRERISLVGGTIAIKSKPHHGTVVSVRIPIGTAPMTARNAS